MPAAARKSTKPKPRSAKPKASPAGASPIPASVARDGKAFVTCVHRVAGPGVMLKGDKLNKADAARVLDRIRRGCGPELRALGSAISRLAL